MSYFWCLNQFFFTWVYFLCTYKFKNGNEHLNDGSKINPLTDTISGEILKIYESYLHELHYIIYKQNRLVCLEHRELGEIRERRRNIESENIHFHQNLRNNSTFPVIILTLYYNVNTYNNGNTISHRKKI